MRPGSAPPPSPPREADLLALEQVSQYAAWVYAFGRKVNHFTGAVSNVEQWQQRMREAGVPMKAEIEGEPGGPLRQTATHAAPVELALEGGGRRTWPYAYFEIAERNGGFDGFFTTQARALFDMTSRSLKKALTGTSRRGARPATPPGGAGRARRGASRRGRRRSAR